MIERREVQLPTKDRQRLLRQRQFLVEKLDQSPKPMSTPAYIVAALAGVSAFLLSAPWWVVIIVVAVPVWIAARSQDQQRLTEIRKTSLETCDKQLESGDLVELEVSSSEIWSFSESDDEGAAFLFRTEPDEWFLLQGQDFDPDSKWPCRHFVLRLDSDGLLFDLVPLSPKAAVDRKLDSRLREGLPYDPLCPYTIVKAQEADVLEALAGRCETGYA